MTHGGGGPDLEFGVGGVAQRGVALVLGSCLRVEELQRRLVADRGVAHLDDGDVGDDGLGATVEADVWTGGVQERRECLLALLLVFEELFVRERAAVGGTRAPVDVHVTWLGGVWREVSRAGQPASAVDDVVVAAGREVAAGRDTRGDVGCPEVAGAEGRLARSGRALEGVVRRA